MKAIQILKEIAKEKKFTPAQIAISWLMHKGNNIVPIPGTTKLKNLEQNIASATVKLTSTEINKIENVFSPGKIAGNRYNADFMKLVDK